MWETHLKAILMSYYLYFLFCLFVLQGYDFFFFFFSQKHLTLGIPLIITSSLNPIPEPTGSTV